MLLKIITAVKFTCDIYCDTIKQKCTAQSCYKERATMKENMPSLQEVYKLLENNYNAISIANSHTITSRKDYFDQIEYGYENLLEGDYLEHTYHFVLRFCLENNIKSITDIGTAYSIQGNVFNKYGIEYNAINSSSKDTQDPYIEFANYQHAIYGKDYTKTNKKSLAVASLSLGWPCYVNEEETDTQYKQLSKDFDSVLLYIPDNEDILKKYFKYVYELERKWIFATNKRSKCITKG